MRVLESMEQVLEKKYDDAQELFEALTTAVIQGTKEEACESPWQFGAKDDAEYTSSFLGLINGALELTIGVVLVAVVDEDDGHLLHWTLQKPWWDSKPLDCGGLCPKGACPKALDPEEKGATDD